MKKTILPIRRATIFLGVFSAFVFALCAPAFPARASLTAVTPENVLTLVNIERHAAGLAPLSMNDDLTRAAQAKITDIFRNDYFAHTAPNGTTPWFWIEQSGYPYVYAGENLAMNFTSVMAQHRAWMNSATHRQNILSDRYDEIGIAAGQGVVSGVSTTVAVQLFGAQHFAVAQKPSSDPATQKNETPAIRTPSYQTLTHVPITSPSAQASQYALRGIIPEFSEELSRGFAWLFIVLMTSIALFVDFVLLFRARHHGMAHPQ
ncbi:MAG TPA: CAP domain-containing protein [Patescibacteria group bacterium]|nr:CAP domain-containing protein [Patescibacteria group bacterium]